MENGVGTRGCCHVPHIRVGIALPPKNVCRQKWCQGRVDGWWGGPKDRMVETCGAVMHLRGTNAKERLLPQMGWSINRMSRRCTDDLCGIPYKYVML
ncbi:hypothetical protein AVEN_168994-1 [Araneus ventricosus]|uniref:Uncharacterized protein n=1 Tax=Araneus ventricosus TaxID=182803 RepID=A0A4Y2KG93_ARAVE|nr:hypothetical protein AVEN_168994-1 [Araneus ventricosus]